MMPSWCRQVNWGNCGIPWVNCAVLCVIDEWKDGYDACAIACQNCAVNSVFPLGMNSHSKIAQFNWDCIGRLRRSYSASSWLRRIQKSVPCIWAGVFGLHTNKSSFLMLKYFNWPKHECCLTKYAVFSFLKVQTNWLNQWKGIVGGGGGRSNFNSATRVSQ